MNQTTKNTPAVQQPTQQVAPIQKAPANEIGMSPDGKIRTQNLAEVMKLAEMLSRGGAGIPPHFTGQPGACAVVIMQALHWEMSVPSVMQQTYLVGKTIAYMAQLITALIHVRSGIQGRLRYEYTGEGQQLRCTVTGKLDGEIYTYTSPPIGLITVKNSPLWKSDPEQQLGYYSARAWGRRYVPEVLLGVYDKEEAQQMEASEPRDITPRYQQQQEAAAMTFDPLSDDEPDFATTTQEYDPETGELNEDQTSTNDDPAAASPATGSSGAEADESPASASASPEIDEDKLLIRFARDVLPRAAKAETTGGMLQAIERRWAGDIAQMSPAGVEKAKAISKSMRAILNDPVRLEGALEHFAEMLGCAVEELAGDE